MQWCNYTFRQTFHWILDPCVGVLSQVHLGTEEWCKPLTDQTHSARHCAVINVSTWTCFSTGRKILIFLHTTIHTIHQCWNMPGFVSNNLFILFIYFFLRIQISSRGNPPRLHGNVLWFERDTHLAWFQTVLGALLLLSCAVQPCKTGMEQCVLSLNTSKQTQHTCTQ